MQELRISNLLLVDPEGAPCTLAARRAAAEARRLVDRLDPFEEPRGCGAPTPPQGGDDARGGPDGGPGVSCLGGECRTATTGGERVGRRDGGIHGDELIALPVQTTLSEVPTLELPCLDSLDSRLPYVAAIQWAPPPGTSREAAVEAVATTPAAAAASAGVAESARVTGVAGAAGGAAGAAGPTTATARTSTFACAQMVLLPCPPVAELSPPVGGVECLVPPLGTLPSLDLGVQPPRRWERGASEWGLLWGTRPDHSPAAAAAAARIQNPNHGPRVVEDGLDSGFNSNPADAGECHTHGSQAPAAAHVAAPVAAPVATPVAPVQDKAAAAVAAHVTVPVATPVASVQDEAAAAVDAHAAAPVAATVAATSAAMQDKAASRIVELPVFRPRIVDWAPPSLVEELLSVGKGTFHLPATLGGTGGGIIGMEGAQ